MSFCMHNALTTMHLIWQSIYSMLFWWRCCCCLRNFSYAHGSKSKHGKELMGMANKNMVIRIFSFVVVWIHIFNELIHFLLTYFLCTYFILILNFHFIFVLFHLMQTYMCMLSFSSTIRNCISGVCVLLRIYLYYLVISLHGMSQKL